MSCHHGIRERIVAEAMAWVGTPYRHQGWRKGVGCDCLGLIRGVWQSIYWQELPDPGAYSPDWAETSAEDRFLIGARRFFTETPGSHARPGDMILFRWRPHLPAKHCGILVAQDRFAHAYQGNSVQVSALVPQWRRRLAAAFAFPDQFL